MVAAAVLLGQTSLRRSGRGRRASWLTELLGVGRRCWGGLDWSAAAALLDRRMLRHQHAWRHASRPPRRGRIP